MVMTEIDIASPVGKYTQHSFRSHEKLVYYNNETDYFIYNRGDEWAVSILTLFSTELKSIIYVSLVSYIYVTRLYHPF